MAKEDWSEAKAWMRATRERIGMTQHDAAVLACVLASWRPLCERCFSAV